MHDLLVYVIIVNFFMKILNAGVSINKYPLFPKVIQKSQLAMELTIINIQTINIQTIGIQTINIQTILHLNSFIYKYFKTQDIQKFILSGLTYLRYKLKIIEL